MQLQYEQWLNHQDQVLKQQLHYYEGEIQKLRKVRKVNEIKLICILKLNTKYILKLNEKHFK